MRGSSHESDRWKLIVFGSLLLCAAASGIWFYTGRPPSSPKTQISAETQAKLKQISDKWKEMKKPGGAASMLPSNPQDLTQEQRDRIASEFKNMAPNGAAEVHGN